MVHCKIWPQSVKMRFLRKWFRNCHTCLPKSWILLGQRISTLDPCHELCLSWFGLPRHEHKWTWLSRLGSHRSEILHLFFEDLACQVLKCYIFATPCPQVLTMTALFKTWLSKSSNLSGSRISTLDPCRELCLSWLGLPRHEHNWKKFFKTWQPHFWNLTPCVQDLACQVL